MVVTATAASRKPGISNRTILLFGLTVLVVHIFQEVFIGQNPVGAFVSNCLQIGCAALAAGACARAYRRAIGSTRLFWTLIGLSLAIWLLADIGWIYNESFLRVSPARDSILHFFVDCRALLLAMALLLDLEEHESGHAGWLLDVCQLFIIFTLIYLEWYQAASYGQSRKLSILRSDQIELGENIAVVALIIAQMVRARSPEIRKLYQSLLICLVPLLAGICLTDYGELQRGVEVPTGTWMDIWWSIAFLMTAVWAMRWEFPAEALREKPKHRHFWSMLLENAFYAAGPLIVLIQVKQLGPDWRRISFLLLGVSILCFAARLALSELRETKVAIQLGEANQSLLDRESRLREFERVVEGLDEMIVVLGRDYRYLLVNPAFLRYRGMKQEELIGRSARDVLQPDVFDNEIKPRLDECFRGKVVRYEMRYSYAGKSKRDLAVSYFPIAGPDGVDRAAGILEDITDRKKAEQALRESEDRYRDLVEHSEDLVCTHDLQGNLLSANPAPARMLGYEIDELLKVPMRDLVAPEFKEQFDNYLETIKTNGSARGVLWVIAKNGERRVWEYSNTLRTVGVSRPIVRGLAHDITERKRAEAALRQSDARMRLLVEHSPAAIAILDRDMRYVQASRRWLEDYGVSNRDLHGMSHYDLFPEIPERWRQVHRRALSGEVVADDKDRFERADGTVQWIRWQVRPWREPNGEIGGIAIFSEDITASQTAEAELRRSEQRYRTLFEKNLAGVVISDADGIVLTCNDAWARMLGYDSAEEVRGRPNSDFYFNVKDRIPLLQHLQQHGAFYSRDMQLRRKDGSVVWVLININLQKSEDGSSLTQATAIDITERRKAEAALRSSEERFRVALKDSPITVFNQDQELRYTWIYNPQPYWQQDVLGKTDDEIFGSRKAAALMDLKKKVLSSKVAVREEIAIPQNGNRHVFDITVEPLLDSQKEVIGITGAAIDIARLRELADRLQESTEQLSREKSYLQEEIETELGFENIIGQSSSLHEVLRKTRVVAPTDSTVLLLGETGTGKELVARSVHNLSTRCEHTFIKLNCAAVPSGLLESELFGHEKGAFTGAVSQKIGRIELAHKGTLFLDEIGEMPLELQPKLLRVLQDREFERLGGVKTIFADVRIIAATNRELRQDVEDNRFREDLFYRLNVFPIELPALRNRKEDIPLLVHHFVNKHNLKMRKNITDVPNDVMRVLCKWSWPGNIRELENMIERMVIMSHGSKLVTPPAEIQQEVERAEDDLVEMEREHILRILRMTHGVLSGPDGAASRLGLKRTTLQSMLKRFGIEPAEYRGWGDGTSGRH